ncbi:T6SS effector BTH_I2691 family protein [Chimaeribacter arupi]|uniref:T6SS effector BTH_I2691 family protein n=1 Tax=Chimaeribacter arupi TaxID=2060066 RepID=UPI002946D20B|nr:T6SS effector BTH_I2691 family protein [Chimaeribacter arupi]MDV5142418.1 T6SS effector BTH_I2691 family protein [Chimaeribacter arupi]
MYTPKGCSFCRRVGLPILPVRPAVMEKGDRLPRLPESITVPVAAEGDTEYTARLLRQGFLYIWDEYARMWRNYYVTSDGYFYPLPENGSVTPRLASGELKPCITSPEELATASLVTLPVMPAGMLNGVYWFCWSEEQWTKAVRQRYEKAVQQGLPHDMQRFDMDAWLMTHSGQQILPFSMLTDTVAEYSPKFNSSTMQAWTPCPCKAVNARSAVDLQKAAEVLHAGNGVLLVLPDPVAVTMEISALTGWRMDQAFISNPDFKRGIALTTMLTGIELAMRTQFEHSYEISDEQAERRIRYGTETPAGPRFPAPQVADRLHERHEESRTERVDEVWLRHYEKYIDRAQQQAFIQDLEARLTAYNQQVIVPVTRMYLNWLESRSMKDYFIRHFDTTSAHSGARYLQTVFTCLAGMMDKKGVADYVDQQLNQTVPTQDNYLLRAVFFNHDAWMADVEAEIKTGKDWWTGLSWDRLADAGKEFSEKYSGVILLGLEKLGYLWHASMMKSISLMVKGTPVRFAIGLLAMQGKMFIPVTVQTGTKHYVNAMTRGMAGLLEMNGRTGGQLYSAMRKEAMLMLRNMPEGTVNVTLPAVIDVDAARALRALPEAERLAKLRTVLRSEDEIVRMLFPRAMKMDLAGAQGPAGSAMAKEITRQGLPFAGSIFSAYFQCMVLHLAWKENGWPGEAKEQIRFASNAAMATTAVMEVLKRVLTPLAPLELPSVISSVLNPVLKFVSSGWWGGLGYIAGIAYASQEMWDGAVDIKNRQFDTGIAHLISGLGVALVTTAGGKAITLRFLLTVGLSEGVLAGSELLAFMLGPAGLLIGALLILGGGTWLISQARNPVQNWLLRMQWRRIPEGENDIPPVYFLEKHEREEYLALSAEASHV